MSTKSNQTVRVNTASLRDYADTLKALNLRTENLKIALEAACAASGVAQLQQQLRPEVLTAGKSSVDRCIRYLQDTAADFEALERELSGKL